MRRSPRNASAFSELRVKRLARAAERFMWRCADMVLPVTEVLTGHLTPAGVPRTRIAVAPNGINLEDFDGLPAKVASEAVQLGFVGFVRHPHGLDRAQRGLAAWQGAPRLDLTVVGDGPTRIDLESLAAEVVLADGVRFTGLARREAKDGTTDMRSIS
jgi:glycosyltransferase involved in cell wall biosynthesis